MKCQINQDKNNQVFINFYIKLTIMGVNMINRFGKSISITVILQCLCSLIFFNILFCTQSQVVKAQSFEQHIPSFTLYCKDENIINCSSINYDFIDNDLFSQSKGKLKASYNILNANRTVEFSIPFLSNAINMPLFNINANGQKIIGDFLYGNVFSKVNNELDYITQINNINPPQIENIFGILYKIIPDEDIVTINLSFNNKNRNNFIYEETNNYEYSNDTNGNYKFILKQALENSSYSIFVIDNLNDHSFSSNSKYTSTIVSCKDYIDNEYKKWEQYYLSDNISINFFYAILNNFLQNKKVTTYQYLFFNSLFDIRLNSYTFKIPIYSDMIINCELPIQAQKNITFNPTIYLVEQKHLNNYPINYTVRLNSLTPFIIETNCKINKNETFFTFETTKKDFYFVFCSSEKAINAINSYSPNENKNIVIIYCIFTCASIFYLIFLIIILFRHNK